MEPEFGWTLLSAEAIRRAEARLREDTKGVRDEIGFLFLHQAYADRFFPGTSVLQKRLRPRGTSENQPMRDTSIPANGCEAEAESSNLLAGD